MPDYSTLISAITDVGDWRWWAGDYLPDNFQIEFGGVQIYEPPKDPSKPPLGMLALRFRKPSLVQFLRRRDQLSDLPVDWHQQLHDDKIEPFHLPVGDFALGNDAHYAELMEKPHDKINFFTNESGGTALKFVFWAYGGAGLRIEASEVGIVLMSGEIDLDGFERMNRDWWAYWRDYWKKKDTPEALPKSYVCEVTIPIKADDK